jgi:hypothetical protein
MVRGGVTRSAWSGSIGVTDRDHFEVVDSIEVSSVARVHRQLVSDRDRGDHRVVGPRMPCAPTSRESDCVSAIKPACATECALTMAMPVIPVVPEMLMIEPRPTGAWYRGAAALSTSTSMWSTAPTTCAKVRTMSASSVRSHGYAHARRPVASISRTVSS